MAKRPRHIPATTLCRAALARGPLRRGSRGRWQFAGRRDFASFTVAAVIAAGDAERRGNQVVRVAPCPASPS